MKSILSHLKAKSMIRTNRKGQVIDSVTGTIVSVFVTFLIIFALLYGISVLNPSTFFTASSLAQNVTTQFQNNATQLAGNFGQQLPVVGTIFGVVLIMSVLAIFVLYVLRFKGQATNGGGSL